MTAPHDGSRADILASDWLATRDAEVERRVREAVAREIEAVRIVCPDHGIPDCSPLLNGCSVVIRLNARCAEDARIARSVEPRPADRGCVMSEHSAERDVPKGMWAKASRGWNKWGPWHYVPDRMGERGWKGHGVTAICGANLYRRSDLGVHRQKERPTERLCLKCTRVTSPVGTESDE